MSLVVGLMSFIGCELCAGSAFAAPATGGTNSTKPARPTSAVQWAGCVTAECHATVKAFRSLHAPVGMNACDACHAVADVKAHTFTLKRQKAELCTYCHEFNVEGIPVVHAPVAKGECLGCHDPHGGVDRRLTRETSMPALCGRCHDDVTKGRPHVHDPIAKGACESCHTAHASRFPKLLYAEGDALCLSCHRTYQKQLAATLFKHQALKEGCGKCHEAHASDQPKQLKQPITDMCLSCHEKVKDAVTLARYKHSVVTKERACMTCHTAHGSDMPGLMTDVPLRICMTCHNEKQQTDRGHVVAALPELNDPKTYKHGPVKDGRCGACHQTHGSDEPMLLLAANAGSLYQSFTTENYKLCFTCHDARLARDERTATATRFRNGEQNLHYLHVNRGERGRNCRVCHSTHASNSPQHVNDSIQFVKWRAPLGFQKTEAGGTCTAGCHPSFGAYDRLRATTRPTTQPGAFLVIASPPADNGGAQSADPVSPEARPTTTPIATGLPMPAAELPRPLPVEWSLTGASGAAVMVPDRDRPTVLVFSRTNHAEEQDLFKELASAVPSKQRAAVVLILGGDDAEKFAKEMAASKKVPWPVVADTADKLFNQLDVHVWPTTIVLKPDGSQVARVAGASESLGIGLVAYLDFAVGKIDREVLARRLTAHSAVGDTPQRKVQRQIQAARALLAAATDPDAAARAMQVLDAALAEQPDSVSLKVEAIRVLIRAGDGRRAMAVLDTLPGGALPAGEAEVLRARVQVDQYEWRQAGELLHAALKLDPSLREAHYLLGVVHERLGDWKQAAEAYRKASELDNK